MATDANSMALAAKARRSYVEGLLNGTERIDAPPQLNPFAMAAREQTREKQTEML